MCLVMDSIQKPTLLYLEESMAVQDHIVESKTESPIVEEINEKFVANTVKISLNETDILQLCCAHQLFAHRPRRQPSRRKQRKCFKSWRFKFKNPTKYKWRQKKLQKFSGLQPKSLHIRFMEQTAIGMNIDGISKEG